MTEESTMGTNLSRKATLLLAEVLAMGNRVLPLSVAGKIQVRIPLSFASFDPHLTLSIGHPWRIRDGHRLREQGTPNRWNIGSIRHRQLQPQQVKIGDFQPQI